MTATMTTPAKPPRRKRSAARRVRMDKEEFSVGTEMRKWIRRMPKGTRSHWARAMLAVGLDDEAAEEAVEKINAQLALLGKTLGKPLGKTLGGKQRTGLYSGLARLFALIVLCDEIDDGPNKIRLLEKELAARRKGK